MNPNEVIIAPSILAADFARLGEQVQAATQAGAGWIHIDVMDGQFVPNITMGPVVIRAVKRVTNLPLDVHLMIVEPDHLIADFTDAGASHIVVHAEACRDLYRTLNLIKRHGCRAGVAINPHTPLSAIEEALPLLDEVIVMTVSPGFGGQSLIEQTLPKVKRLRAMVDEAHDAGFPIVADGGVNVDTAARVVESGCNVVVIGSSIFEGGSVADNMQSIRTALADK